MRTENEAERQVTVAAAADTEADLAVLPESARMVHDAFFDALLRGEARTSAGISSPKARP